LLRCFVSGVHKFGKKERRRRSKKANRQLPNFAFRLVSQFEQQTVYPGEALHRFGLEDFALRRKFGRALCSRKQFEPEFMLKGYRPADGQLRCSRREASRSSFHCTAAVKYRRWCNSMSRPIFY
jgi:hypothetical protein